MVHFTQRLVRYFEVRAWLRWWRAPSNVESSQVSSSLEQAGGEIVPEHVRRQFPLGKVGFFPDRIHHPLDTPWLQSATVSIDEASRFGVSSKTVRIGIHA